MSELQKAYDILNNIKDNDNVYEIALSAYNTSNYCLEAFCLYVKNSNLSFNEKLDLFNKENYLIKNDSNNLISNESYLNYLFEYGLLYLDNDCFDKCIKIFEYILDFDSNDIKSIYNYLISLYVYLEDESKIINLNNKYGKDNLYFYFNLAIYYFKKCEFDKCDYYLDLIKEKDTRFINNFINNIGENTNYLLNTSSYLINTCKFKEYLKENYD